jgi:hypothetical protein
MTATDSLDRSYAAKWEIDSARGHLDTAACHINDAVGHLDGARRTRAQEILDHVSAVLADLDRLRAAL